MLSPWKLGCSLYTRALRKICTCPTMKKGSQNSDFGMAEVSLTTYILHEYASAGQNISNFERSMTWGTKSNWMLQNQKEQNEEEKINNRCDDHMIEWVCVCVCVCWSRLRTEFGLLFRCLFIWLKLRSYGNQGQSSMDSFCLCHTQTSRNKKANTQKDRHTSADRHIHIHAYIHALIHTNVRWQWIQESTWQRKKTLLNVHDAIMSCWRKKWINIEIKRGRYKCIGSDGTAGDGGWLDVFLHGLSKSGVNDLLCKDWDS
jgi:hypothetical protein